MAKYYKEKTIKEKTSLLSKIIQGIIVSVVVGIIILIFKSLITSIPIAMVVTGVGVLIVSLFLHPSYKAIYHSLICAACSGLVLLNFTPFVANIHLFEGYKASVAKKWDITIKNYQKALKFDSRDGELNFYAGYAYMKKKDYIQADYHFKKSLETKLDPSAFNNLGNVYLEGGKFEEAENAYKDALYTQVSRMYSLNNLGAIYQKTGRLDESLDAFKQALEASPGYEIAKKNLEIVENLKKKYAYVEKRYGKDFLRYFFTAQSYLQQKRGDKAKEFFLKAKALLLKRDKGIGPEHPDWNEVRGNLNSISLVYSVVGSNLVKLDELREAIFVYELTLNLKPGNIKQLYNYIASLYLKIGEKEKADEMLKKARSPQ